MKKTIGVFVAMSIALVACSRGARIAGASARNFSAVKVGLLITTGGKGGDLAGPSIGAANVAVQRLKSEHHVDVKIEQADYQGDLATVPDLARELESKSDVLVIGTDDPAVMPQLQGLTKPVLLAYITADDATAAENFYRLAPSDSLQAKVLAAILVDHRNLSRLGVIFENGDYGKGGADLFEKAVTQAGATLVAKEGFDTGGDIHTPAELAADRGAQAVVLWTDNPAEAARIVIDVHHSALSYQLALPFDIAVPQFGKNASAQVVPTAFREGILSVGPWAGPWLNESRITDFYKQFQKLQNDVAPVRTSTVFDAVLLASIAKTEGSITQGLGGIRDFEGAGAPITFDSHREGIDESDLWAWGFTKSKSGAGVDFFPAVDTGGGFFTLIKAGNKVPARFRYELS
ncbi:MAG: ABC transporter substrate-binding protein [Actinomycetota bacterium]|nr:ABC transporter substrate-binding protein [Actinomycetota bacterium]